MNVYKIAALQLLSIHPSALVLCTQTWIVFPTIMLSKYAAAAILLSAATNASPLLFNDDSLVARQKAGSYLPIVGATGGNHPRLEIRELEKTGMF